MINVLIPFADPDGGKRAVRQLLAEAARTDDLTVELLAIVEPLTPGKVSIYLGARQAEAFARDAAQRWLRDVGALLASAGVCYRSTVAIGSVSRHVREALRRGDVDRVLLPARGVGWLSRLRAATSGGKHALDAHRIVTIVG